MIPLRLVHRFLIIQTAFIGDVVLATALIEKLRNYFPNAEIDFLLRQGNESLLEKHPQLRNVLVWNKKKNKLWNLLALAFKIRRNRYTCVVNVHRFASSGFLTWFSGAKQKRGFANNPFSWAYSNKVVHQFSKPADSHFIHETERNQSLIADLTDETPARPKLYPGAYESTAVSLFQHGKYICIAPSSVWATKRFPVQHWASLVDMLPAHLNIFLLGAKEDASLADELISLCQRKNIENLCGRLNMMQSTVLMRDAEMNYANDSGPVHFASALNAPMTAVFCSTHECYGFGPLSDHSRLVEVQGLYCKPCGLHGYDACPEKHFRCAHDLNLKELLWWITPTI